MNQALIWLLEKNQAHKSPFLDLGNLGLDGTEPELQELRNYHWLESLNLGYYWHTYEQESYKYKLHYSSNQGVRNRLLQAPTFLPDQLRHLFLVGFITDLKKMKVWSGVSLQNLSLLQTLEVSGYPLIELTILPSFTSLKHLFMDYIYLGDASPLSECTQLQSLHLGNTKIREIDFLESLSQLQHLDLTLNPLGNIEVLAKLPHLKHLELGSIETWRNHFDAIISEGIPDLEYLNISNNRIDDREIGLFSNFPQLKTLQLNNCRLSKFHWLEKLENPSFLSELSIFKNNIGELDFLRQAPNLQQLNLCANWLQNISILGELRQLRHLSLSNNEIEDISPLQHCQNLEVCFLNHNQIRDITCLTKLPNLKFLSCTNNKITQAVFKNEQTLLNTLDLSNNQIEQIYLSNLDALSELVLKSESLKNLFLIHLPKLKHLSITDVQVDEIVIDQINDLEYLNISSLNTENQEFILNFKKLKELKLSTSGIKDISFLNELKYLEKLDISINDVSNLELNGLTSLKSIFAVENPLEKVFLKDLPSLEHLELSIQEDKGLRLEGLNNLERLTLQGDIQHVLESSFILEIPQLAYLTLIGEPSLKKYAYSTKIDISKLSNLPELVSLEIIRGNLINVQAFKDFRKLERLLIEYSKFDQNEAFPVINHLKELGLIKVMNIDQLIIHGSAYPFLESLKIREVNFSIIQVEQLPLLKEFDFQMGKFILNTLIMNDLPLVKTLSFSSTEGRSFVFEKKIEELIFKNMIGLEKLFLETDILLPPDLSFLKEAPNLKELRIGFSGDYNPDISAVAFLKHLELLYFKGPSESNTYHFSKMTSFDISPLKNLGKLTELKLCNLKIENVQELALLHNLVKLDISSNKITDISPLQNLTALVDIDVSRNEIQDFSIIKNLPKLKKISIKGNQFSKPPLRWILMLWDGFPVYGQEFAELPYLDKIWGLMSSRDEENINLALELAASVGWPAKDIEAYRKFSRRYF